MNTRVEIAYDTASNFEEFRDTLWGVADGRQIKIRDLELSHLVNILNWVRDRPRQYAAELYPLLEQELELRRLLQFSQGGQIPFKGTEGTWQLPVDIQDDSVYNCYIE